MADAICRLATGAGFGKRKLYTDDEEHIASVVRPVLLNGIPNLLARSDLASRALAATLPQIPDEARLPEEDIQRRFEAIAPEMFGLLLDGLATALKRLPKLKLAAFPRMADFARLACAAAPAFGWTEEEVLAAIDDSAATAVIAIIEGDPVAGAVQALAQTLPENGKWKGTATALLEKLNWLVSETVLRSKAWPKDATRLSGRLRRLAPALRAVGVAINLDDRDGHDRTRTITISRPVHKGFSASAASAAFVEGEQNHNANATADAGADPASAREGSADAEQRRADGMRTLAASAVKTGESSDSKAADAADANFANPDREGVVSRPADSLHPENAVEAEGQVPSPGLEPKLADGGGMTVDKFSISDDLSIPKFLRR
jgi:hypothetical protein